jgi:hypothetical protein
LKTLDIINKERHYCFFQKSMLIILSFSHYL